jgi:uncharacterized protein (DUF433 family)
LVATHKQTTGWRRYDHSTEHRVMKKNKKTSHDKLVDVEDLLSRIAIDPNVCQGNPCIRGHRIWVSLVLDFLAGGMTPEEILDYYPGIEEADVRACIAYGAEMARGNFVDVVLCDNE